jgi:serine/threonine protein kinase
MSLTPGSKLGPYEILEPIGAGGMGEVFRARDTRLNRDVAVKVSAERFSERFDREARVIASLNHPNICTLFDVGPNYLVMELVEGPTLADRIKEGAIPLDEALPIARQIADALDAAHDKGITHRDLKPGNVKIKPDGTVKVLDFGLAKTGGTQAVASDNSPTLTIGQTEAGVILGTASYMAPEQAKGKPVDKRADIYAFGVVMYEMLTGKRLHQGETTTEILASVLKEEPKWNKVPAQVQRLLQRCLEKDPQKRLRHIGDMMALVDDPANAPKAAPARTPWLWPSITGALAIALAVAGWIWWRTPRFTDLPLVRQEVELGSDIALPTTTPYVTNVVISPDGTRVVFVASVSGGPQKLFTRRLDQPKANELPGTEGARGPFFSPDGRWVGFGTGPKLNRISVDGGAVLLLANLTGTFGGAAWGEDGIIVAQTSIPMQRIPPGGGQPTPVMEFASKENIQTSPQILPGGKAVLFAANTKTGSETATVEVVSLTDHHRKTLVQGGAFPRYVPSFKGTGHLLYTHEGTLLAIAFDPEKLETHGTAVSILDDITGPNGIAGKFDVSLAGTLVYQKGLGGGQAMVTVQWLDAAGRKEPLLAKPGTYVNPSLSPDGKRLAMAVFDGGRLDIQVYEWQSERTTKLTFGGGQFADPVWSPDGRYVVFASQTGGTLWTRSDGAGQPQPLTQSRTIQIPSSFSSDGKRLTYAEQLGGPPQIWTVAVEEESGQLKAGMPEPFLKDQFADSQPSFSPDGKWIAYSSTEAGTNPEVYVRPFPPSATGGKWVISNQGGTRPIWARSGRDLFYLGRDGLMAVSYTLKGDAFVAEKPRMWLPNPATANFDLAPDGKRLAVMTPVAAADAPKPEHQVVFLENFFDELRRRAPIGK